MVKNLFLQLLFFLVLFHSISWFRELSLLDTDGSQAAPQVILKAFDGSDVHLESLQGKPTLVYFWAPWCSVCKVSMPNLQDFYDKHNQEVNVLAIALSYESQEEVTEFMSQKAYTFDAVLGDNSVAQKFKIQGFPTYYFLDENNKVVSKSMGYTSEIGMTIRSFVL